MLTVAFSYRVILTVHASVKNEYFKGKIGSRTSNIFQDKMCISFDVDHVSARRDNQKVSYSLNIIIYNYFVNNFHQV